MPHNVGSLHVYMYMSLEQGFVIFLLVITVRAKQVHKDNVLLWNAHVYVNVFIVTFCVIHVHVLGNKMPNY